MQGFFAHSALGPGLPVAFFVESTPAVRTPRLHPVVRLAPGDGPILCQGSGGDRREGFGATSVPHMIGEGVYPIVRYVPHDVSIYGRETVADSFQGDYCESHKTPWGDNFDTVIRLPTVD